jgi:hypothetical protein
VVAVTVGELAVVLDDVPLEVPLEVPLDVVVAVVAVEDVVPVVDPLCAECWTP